MLVGDHGPVVVVSPRAAALLAGPLGRLFADVQRRDGARPDAELVALLGELERAGQEYRRRQAAAGAERDGTSGIPAEEPPLMLRVVDVAELLHCSPRNVRALAERESLPAVARRPWRFDPSDVSAYLAAKEIA
jgi:hypothetical protein